MTLNLNDDVFKHLAQIPCRIAGLQERVTVQPTVDPRYSQLCICEFTYWLKSIYNPQINNYSTFTVICGHAQSGEKSESPEVHIPS